MRRSGSMAVFASAAALALAAPAAAATVTTVNATVTGFLAPLGLNRTVLAPVSPNATLTVSAARAIALRNGGSYPYALLGGPKAAEFVAFCIEPLELLPVGSEVPYTVVPLSRAATGLGDIGEAKASLIRELFGRRAPAGGFAAMTAETSVAFQLAIWEIVSEKAGSTYDLFSGNASFTRTRATTSSFLSAGLWLKELDGKGPMAKGLVVLRNGTVGVQGSGSQDLLVFAAVPEPATWAMLIAGFGLVGAAGRRRRIAVAA